MAAQHLVSQAGEPSEGVHYAFASIYLAYAKALTYDKKLHDAIRTASKGIRIVVRRSFAIIFKIIIIIIILFRLAFASHAGVEALGYTVTNKRKESIVVVELPANLYEDWSFDPVAAELLSLLSDLMLESEKDALHENGKMTPKESAALDILKNALILSPCQSRISMLIISRLACQRFRARHRLDAIADLRRSVGTLSDAQFVVSTQRKRMRAAESLNDLHNMSLPDSLHADEYLHSDDFIPVCTITLTDRKSCIQGSDRSASIMITRCNSKGVMVAVRCPSVAHGGQSVLQGLQELERVISECTAQQKHASSTTVSRKEWWQGRIDLDNRIRSLLEAAASWLGPWHCLLLGEPEKWLEDAVQLCTINTARSLLEEEHSDEDFELLTRLIAGAFIGVISRNELVHGMRTLAASSLTECALEQCVDMVVAERSNIDEHTSFSPRSSVVLVCDSTLATFPWESITGTISEQMHLKIEPLNSDINSMVSGCSYCRAPRGEHFPNAIGNNCKRKATKEARTYSASAEDLLPP